MSKITLAGTEIEVSGVFPQVGDVVTD
ncbi:thiol peroxidase, partial [Pasteurella multocida subsp. multocida str. Anand1_buffalo]